MKENLMPVDGNVNQLRPPTSKSSIVGKDVNWQGKVLSPSLNKNSFAIPCALPELQEKNLGHSVHEVEVRLCMI